MDLLKADDLRMTSKEIAELTGKRHDNVLRDCDTLNANYLKMSLLKIEEEYFPHPSGNGQAIRKMHLTKMQVFDLMTGYNTALRIKVNRRWEELENEKQQRFQIPQTLSGALMLAAKQAEQIEKQQAVIEESKPKVEFADAIMCSDDSISIAIMGKMIGIGEKTLFQKLRDDNILSDNRWGNRWNTPYQKYIDAGYFELTEKPWQNEQRSGISFQTKITTKGQAWLAKKY